MDYDLVTDFMLKCTMQMLILSIDFFVFWLVVVCGAMWMAAS